MGATRSRRATGLLGTAVVVAALVLSGCSQSGGTSAQSDAAPAGLAERPGDAAQQQAPGVADRQAPAGAAEQQGPGRADAAAPVDLRVDQRSIIYTGSITVRVDDVDRAATRAISIATAAGGFVGSDKRSSGDTDTEATLQLRIPADRFTGVVDSLGELGRQQHRDISTEDVTEQTLDLDARIATQRARVESGRRLLAQAKSLSDLVMLEGEVAKREADLASLEAKKRRLADLTALSTITVVLLGPDAGRSDDEPSDGFLAGLRDGWRALTASAQVLLTVLGALLPWFLALGVPVGVMVWLLRRDRNRRSAPPVSAAIPRPAQPVATAPAGTGSPEREQAD